MALITGTDRTLTVQWGNYDNERYGPIYLQVGSDAPTLEKISAGGYAGNLYDYRRPGIPFPTN